VSADQENGRARSELKQFNERQLKVHIAVLRRRDHGVDTLRAQPLTGLQFIATTSARTAREGVRHLACQAEKHPGFSGHRNVDLTLTRPDGSHVPACLQSVEVEPVVGVRPRQFLLRDASRLAHDADRVADVARLAYLDGLARRGHHSGLREEIFTSFNVRISPHCDRLMRLPAGPSRRTRAAPDTVPVGCPIGRLVMRFRLSSPATWSGPIRPGRAAPTSRADVAHWSLVRQAGWGESADLIVVRRGG
jgi:hypothetical protein